MWWLSSTKTRGHTPGEQTEQRLSLVTTPILNFLTNSEYKIAGWTRGAGMGCVLCEFPVPGRGSSKGAWCVSPTHEKGFYWCLLRNCEFSAAFGGCSETGVHRPRVDRSKDCVYLQPGVAGVAREGLDGEVDGCLLLHQEAGGRHQLALGISSQDKDSSTGWKDQQERGPGKAKF